MSIAARGSGAGLGVVAQLGFDVIHHGEEQELFHGNSDGRVYDPTLGRFLSPDPFVFEPISTQGFNRYAYVSNKPLSWTDPYSFKNSCR